MNRYFQTLSRIGSGLAAMSALTWLLWPFHGEWEFSPEPLSAFALALVFWGFAEFKLSEEVVYQASTPNDIRLGREVIAYGDSTFRELLKDHDYHRGIHPRYLSEACLLISEAERGIAHFQDRKVQAKYVDFIDRLREFAGYLGAHSTLESFGGFMKQSVVPARVFDAHNISDQHMTEICEANWLATDAWNSMTPLIDEIKKRIPETFDEPIGAGWIRSSEERALSLGATQRDEV